MAHEAADDGGCDEHELDDGCEGMGLLRRASLLVVLVLALGAAAAFGWSILGGERLAVEARGAAPQGLAAVTIQPAVTAVGIWPGSRVMLSALAVNTSDRPVRIGAIMLDPARGSLGFAASADACRVPVLTFSRQDHAGRGWVVPPRRHGLDGVRRIAMPGALAMGLLAEQECQGSRFAVFLRPVG